MNNVNVSSKTLNTFKIINEDNYFAIMHSIVIPFLSSYEKSGYILGENNVNIFYKHYILENPKGNIVISHGFTECIEKYQEIIYYFLNSGFSVFIHEHRGHARSGILGQADKSQVNVEDYNYYLNDFKQFIDSVVLPNGKDKELFIFAHSMGGGIAARFLELYPNYFSKAVLSSPMLEINTGTTNSLIAKTLSSYMVKTKKHDKFVFGHGPYIDKYEYTTAGTSCKCRYDYFYHFQSNTEEVQRGGASFSWLHQCFKLAADAVKNAVLINIPILLFQAENDDFVKSNGQNTFCKSAKNAELIKVSASKHDIFREKNNILKPYLEKIIAFYN